MFNRAKIFSAIFLVALFVFVNVAPKSFAQMTGSSYKIQSDSINFGGGLSNSSSYKGESTLGEVGTGESGSASFKIKAGYQQMQEVYIAITSASDVVMSPNIGGVSGGTADGSTNVTVTTDSSSGYQLTIKASSSPALVSDVNSFADYTTAGANPDFSFSVASTDSEFAFTPEGADIVQRYLDSGGVCNQPAGSDTSDKCWDTLSTSNTTISSKSFANHPSGTMTTIKFRAESGSLHLQPEGVYTATTTVTALPL